MRTNYIIAGWCYIVSALLDSVDGHAARAFNQSKIKISLSHPPILEIGTTTQFPKSFNICMASMIKGKLMPVVLKQAQNSALCWTSWLIVAALWVFWLHWATSIRVICSCFSCRWLSMCRVTGSTCNRKLDDYKWLLFMDCTARLSYLLQIYIAGQDIAQVYRSQRKPNHATILPERYSNVYVLR